MIRLFIQALKKFKYLIIKLLFTINKFIKTKDTDIESSSKNLFILGSGRNGSTLLALLLNRHEKIFLPPEQYALPYTLTDWQLPFYKNWNKYYKKHLNAYFKKNQHWLVTEEDKHILEKKLANMPKNKQNPVVLFNTIFQYYANTIAGKSNVAFLGDHSPLTTLFYPYVFHYFPKAKYIFLIRHPFDVVLSYQKLKGNPASNPKFACKKWNNSIRAYFYLKSKNYPVLLVKYEDLVNNPNKVLTEILVFLNVEHENLLVSKNNNENELIGAKNISYHENLNKPISNKSVGKWKEKLDKNCVKKLIPIVEKNAQLFNYNLNS